MKQRLLIISYSLHNLCTETPSNSYIQQLRSIMHIEWSHHEQQQQQHGDVRVLA